ncbi:hydrogenase maturation nickel metallochaperone HypA/HybF [Planosporangium mesophilum]|uniref:Hydrogenase maturation factor HypA n=1 Tax=Planosporangium mesophilum TaxID=689768 RepID=A0A8J3X4G0_9ACTN|nr:hydrogenase maturation nickel metallochaperone HypA [Planosporangium mesophilum]NJC82752.1 hydrogenase maturation nickel metallochaperone HypA [Planosporangium mesophilum]GII23778.1 putative hydrogenase nickel incorporation protein HypA [Planosporangium mesophilum]
MHEIGLCEPFVEAIERRAAGRRVTAVRMRIGVLHRVVEPSLEQAFALVSAGTVAEGAAVELVTVPARAACPACGWQDETAEPVALCPACGASGTELIGGDELVLESITVAENGTPGASGTPREEVSSDVSGDSR